MTGAILKMLRETSAKILMALSGNTRYAAKSLGSGRYDTFMSAQSLKFVSAAADTPAPVRHAGEGGDSIVGGSPLERRKQ
jgi:hypothetical protein